jgi:hypothetical protein
MRQSRKVSGSITMFRVRFSMCVVSPQISAKWGFAQAVLAAVREARGIRKDRPRGFGIQLNGRLANSSAHV